MLFALAAFFLVFGPPMDALAREEALAPAPTTLERMLAAFDVIDDVLDHMHGKAPVAQQHHVPAVAAPQAGPEPVAGLSEGGVNWMVLPDPRHEAADLPLPYHPPRT